MVHILSSNNSATTSSSSHVYYQRFDGDDDFKDHDILEPERIFANGSLDDDEEVGDQEISSATSSESNTSTLSSFWRSLSISHSLSSSSNLSHILPIPSRKFRREPKRQTKTSKTNLMVLHRAMLPTFSKKSRDRNTTLRVKYSSSRTPTKRCFSYAPMMEEQDML